MKRILLTNIVTITICKADLSVKLVRQRLSVSCIKNSAFELNMADLKGKKGYKNLSNSHESGFFSD